MEKKKHFFRHSIFHLSFYPDDDADDDEFCYVELVRSSYATVHTTVSTILHIHTLRMMSDEIVGGLVRYNINEI